MPLGGTQFSPRIVAQLHSAHSPPPTRAGTPQPSAAPALRGNPRPPPLPAGQTCKGGRGAIVMQSHHQIAASNICCRRLVSTHTGCLFAAINTREHWKTKKQSPHSPPREGHQQHGLPGGQQRRLPRQHLGVRIVLLRKLQDQPAGINEMGGDRGGVCKSFRAVLLCLLQDQPAG